MKHKITKLPNLPTIIEDIKRVLQELWDKVEPEEWRYLTETLTSMIVDVIKAKGMATIC